MPTYQYACTECDHAFEQVQSFSDDALTECPECRGRLRKLFNAVGVVFKGSGFYRTDSRSNGSSSSSSSTSSSSTSASNGDGSGKKDSASTSDTSTSSTSSTSVTSATSSSASTATAGTTAGS